MGSAMVRMDLVSVKEREREDWWCRVIVVLDGLGRKGVSMGYWWLGFAWVGGSWHMVVVVVVLLLLLLLVSLLRV